MNPYERWRHTLRPLIEQIHNQHQTVWVPLDCGTLTNGNGGSGLRFVGSPDHETLRVSIRDQTSSVSTSSSGTSYRAESHSKPVDGDKTT
jgi:hypothetical protein